MFLSCSVFPFSIYGGAMGHHISQERRDAMECAQRVSDFAPYLVLGWRIYHRGYKIESINSVLGSYQRREEVLFRCKRDDCRRRVTPDLRAAIDAGLGDRALLDLVELLRCRHWSGCRLEHMSSTYPKGVPLVAYVNQDAVVAIVCKECSVRTLLSPAVVIGRLKAAGRGDGSVGILELGERIRGPCKKCRGRHFETNIVWLGEVGG